MKKNLINIVLSVVVCALLASCGSGISGEAKQALSDDIKEMNGQFPKELHSKVKNVNVLFENDSLCVLSLDLEGKNPFGVKTTNHKEFLYIKSMGEAYYGMYDPTEIQVYRTQEDYEEMKVGTIYADLGYPLGLYQLVAERINKHGRPIGITLSQYMKNDYTINIPLPSGTGDWELRHFVNRYGEASGDPYILLEAHGVFSNSVTYNSNLVAYLLVCKNYISFKFVEYGSHLVVNEGTCYGTVMQDGDEVCDLRMDCGEDGQMCVWSDSEEYRKLIKAFEKGGLLECIAILGRYSKSEYSFRFNASGFDKAYKLVK